MFGLGDFFWAIEAQHSIMAIIIGYSDKQVQRLVVGQKRLLYFALGHNVQCVEQQFRKHIPAKGRRKPAGADKARQLDRNLLLRFLRDCPFDRTTTPAQDQPSDRRRPKFGEA